MSRQMTLTGVNTSLRRFFALSAAIALNTRLRVCLTVATPIRQDGLQGQVLAITAIFHRSDTEIALCHAQVEVITSAKVRVHPKVERAWLVVLGQSLTVLPIPHFARRARRRLRWSLNSASISSNVPGLTSACSVVTPHRCAAATR